MLPAFGHHVVTCCEVLGVVGSNLTIFKLEPKTPNMSQHGGQTHATCWPDNVAICWVDRNISMQHIPTLLTLHLQAPAKRSQHFNVTDRNIVGRNMCVFGHPVAMCCELKIELVRMPLQHCCTNLAKWLQHATSTNVAFMNIWPFSNLSQHVATHCNMVVKRTQHVAPNNVALKYCDRLAEALCSQFLLLC